MAVVGGRVTEVLVTADPAGGPPRVQMDVAVAGVEEDAPAAVGPPGRLALHVRSAEGGAVAGARVFFRGLPTEARTDSRGGAEVTIPAGTHDLTVVHASFTARTVTGVEVPEGGATLDVELQPASVALDDLDVVAPRIEGGAAELLDERRESGAVLDLVGAEQMAKTGASDAAAAVQRVTGVTVVGGRFVYVRGLGDRYATTLLNGATLPSPEPERRVVPLDMFPADALESVVVQKSYTPDLPGEFGGGAVLLRTRGFPGTLVAGVGLSAEVRLGTTFEEGLTSEGGPTDFLGIDGGFRAPPDSVLDASRTGRIELGTRFTDGLTDEQLEALGEAMPNRWAIGTRTVPPGFGIEAQVGDSWLLGSDGGDDVRAGFLLSLSYDNDWQRELATETTFRLGAGKQLEPINTYDFRTTTNTVTLAGILAAGLDVGDEHAIRATVLVDRISDDEARRYEGFNSDALTQIRVDRLWWVERMLLGAQGTGHHDLGPLELDWRYTFSRASRIEPDRRTLRFDLEQSLGTYLLSQLSEGNQRLFSELGDDAHDAGLDVTVPFDGWAGPGEVRTGVAVARKDRAVDTRRYTFSQSGPDSSDPAVLALPPEEIFAPEHIGEGGFRFAEVTRPTDNYEASQTLLGGFALVDMPLATTLRAIAGARVEWSEQRAETFEPFSSTAEPSVASLDDVDVLPGVVVSWDVTPAMVLRAGYGRTVSRPDFRELSPAAFNDVVGGRVHKGNPDLGRGVLHHADLRWEWYPGEDGNLSAAVFYKRFEDPIESTIIAGAESVVTYENAAGAHTVGGELEGRLSFGVADPALRDLSIAANASVVWSRVDLDDAGVQTAESRPLQGQSPWVLNAQLAWDDPDLGTSASLLYNVAGPRIAEVGALGAPDVLEEPTHQLDLIFRQRLPEGFKLGFAAKNLIDPEILHTQGGEIAARTRKGRVFSVSLGWSL